MELPTNEDQLKHTLSSLRLIEYTSWGCTETPGLPMQTGSMVEHTVAVRQLIRGLTDAEPSIQRMEHDLTLLFNRSVTEELVADLFWVIFLEYFALLDGRSRLERYKKMLVSRFEEEEQQSALSLRRQNSRTFFLRRKASRQDLMEKEKDVQDDDRKRSHTHHPHHYVSLGTPRHLQTSTVESKESPRSKSRGDSQSPTRPPSRTESVTSVMSATSSSGASAARALLDTLMEPPEDEYEGKTEIVAVLNVLKSAEVIGDEVDTVAHGSDEQSMVQQEALRRAAIDLVRTEQRHMLRRIATAFVSLFRSVKTVKRDVVFGPLADSLSQLECQLMYRLLPYMRSELTTKVKRQIKRRLSYWFTGIETGDIRRWAPISVNSNPLIAPPLSKNVATDTPTSRRASTTASAAGKSPGLPVLEHHASMRWKMAANKAKIVGGAISTFAEAGETHNPVYSKAYLEMRREMKAALLAGSASQLKDSSDALRPTVPVVDVNVPAPPPRPDAVHGKKRLVARQSKEGSQSARHVSPVRILTVAPPLERHALTHRLAVDPRPPRWHEAGRRRENRKLAHDTALRFDSSTVTPLMAIFLDDRDARPATSRNSGMSWSI